MFTLFNLQGALGVSHRFAAHFIARLELGAQLIYISTFILACQALFSFIFQKV